MLAANWNSVKRETFQNCYRKAGFIHPSSAEFVSPGFSEPDYVFNEIDVGMTEAEFIDFCSADSTLQCVFTLTEDEIIQGVLAEREYSQDEIELLIDSSDSDGDVPFVTCNDALNCVEKLKIFLAQVGDAQAIHQSVTVSANSFRKQKKITAMLG